MFRKILFIAFLTLALAACRQNAEDAPPVELDQVEQPVESPMPVELTATARPELLFEGSWFTDQLSLDIFLPPEGGFIFRYAEDNANSCGGGIMRATGTVELNGVNKITLTGTSTCENNDEESNFTLDLTYDPAENVLRDSSGNAWTRS